LGLTLGTIVSLFSFQSLLFVLSCVDRSQNLLISDITVQCSPVNEYDTVMEPEYFNDDDLINDYLEDDNEQPPEEEFPDDFFMTEHFQQQPTQQQQSTQQQQPTTQQQQPTTQPAATTRESTTDHPKETVPRTDISIRAVSSQRKDALYSFERYAYLLSA
jgi:hypothetical protein